MLEHGLVWICLLIQIIIRCHFGFILLQIILVGYQEYEAKEKFAFGDLLDKNNQTKELQESLAFYKEHNIEYVAFTDILKKIGYKEGCWNE